MVTIKILYFAWIREAIGLDGEDVDLPPTLCSPRDVATFLSARSEGHARAFADMARVRCALDQAMQSLDAPLGIPTELAFFPPVTGG